MEFHLDYFSWTSVVSPHTNLYVHITEQGKDYDGWKIARLNPAFKKEDETDVGLQLSPNLSFKYTQQDSRILCCRYII